MLLAQACPGPVRLWLAAEPPRDTEQPDGQGREPELDARSLRVLIVEDEFFISLDTKALLVALGHTVVAVAVTADQAVSIAARERPDLVLMDIRLNGTRDGIDAAAEILANFGIRSVFVTANNDPKMRERAAAVQPLAFLQKPLTRERLRLGLSGFQQNH